MTVKTMFATAAIALAGCYGAGTEPSDTLEPSIEVEAPASTKIHQAISAADAEALLHRSQAAQPVTEGLIGYCPGCVIQPDLTVAEDDRTQLKWDSQRGWYQAYARGFLVRNIGSGNAGTFHVAVLQGSDSYGFDVPGLAAGTSQYFQITKPSDLGPACGVKAVILVNPFNALPESNYNNNSTTVAGLCLL
jgi:hypothetical protein